MSDSRNHQQDYNDALVDRYLRNKLSEQEQTEFEVRMMEDPQLFEMVKAASLMQESLREQLSDQPLPAQHKHLPFTEWIRQPLSLAASAVLCLGIVFQIGAYLEDGSDTGRQLTDTGYAINSVANLGLNRSGTSEVVLQAGRAHLLQIDVGISLVETTYNLSLSSRTNQEEYRFSATADGNGIVRLLTPEALSGSYTLNVMTAGNVDPLESYNIRFE